MILKEIRSKNNVNLLCTIGPVTFEGEPVASTSTSEPMQPPSVNGYRGLLPGNGRLCDMDDITAKLSPISCNNNNEVELDGSARTRAFKSEEFKKRKLFQSTNLHKISRRAARPWYVLYHKIDDKINSHL